MAAGVIHPDGFLYVRHFLDQAANDALVRYLEEVPVVEPAERDVLHRFAFCSPVADGIVVRDRREAAAGWPVWTGASAEQGAEVPVVLADLAHRAGDELARLGHPVVTGANVEFSSLYADRYEPGGLFVPHTDRACYGPVVAGVSVGPGSCRMTFRKNGEVRFSHVIEPGSLYAFFGALREAPCTHEVDHVTGLRFGVSLRTPASALLEVDH